MPHVDGRGAVLQAGTSRFRVSMKPLIPFFSLSNPCTSFRTVGLRRP
jgi:hypothetical protein